MPVLTTGEKRILYLHVPKTGGSWVNRLLRSYGTVTGESYRDLASGLPCTPQHFHAQIVRHVHGTDARAMEHDFDYVFMTVRDPLRRLQSEFRYRYPNERRGHWQQKLGVPARFDAWARRVLRVYPRDPFLFDNHVRPQHEFRVFGAEVFRYEDGLEQVQEALDAVTGRVGMPPERVVNPSSSPLRADYALSDRGRAAIARFYARDYAEFGYEPLFETDHP